MGLKKEYLITATCTFGLERVLKHEIIALGYDIAKSSDGAVSVYGNSKDLFRLNLHLRTANRVLIHLMTLDARTFDELYDGVAAFPWEDHFSKHTKFNVTKISSVKSALFSKSDCQRIIKKAMIDRLSKHYHMKRLPEDGPYYQLFVTIKNDVANLYFNTSGESLHRRGYRLSAGEAPLKETLAAGIVLLSRYDGTQPFADFMCGSGTFIVEAALIASDTPPGILRHFAFEEWGILDPKIRQLYLSESMEKIHQPSLRLLGSDIDKTVLKAARENAMRAHTEDFVSFQTLDFREFRSRKKGGILVCNPPYGERIGKQKETQMMYRDMRDVYERLDGWKLFALCGNDDFQRYFGRKADKNRKLFNGNMQTYLYQYFPK